MNMMHTFHGIIVAAAMPAAIMTSNNQVTGYYIKEPF
jgi:hypothetical protein